MTEEYKNIYQIGEVPLCGEFQLVAVPSLIAVQSIKKKFVEQMPETPLKLLAEHGDTIFRVIGRVGPYVVFHTDSQQFSKIHRNEFVDYAVGVAIKSLPEDERPDSNSLHRDGILKFNGIPQMFEV